MSIKNLILKFLSLCSKISTKGMLLSERYSYRRKIHKLCKKQNYRLSTSQKRDIKNYWKQYSDKFSLDFHCRYICATGNFDVRFIPDDLFYYKIDPKLNERYSALSNKSYYSLLFDCVMPKTVFHKINDCYLDKNFNLISETEAAELCTHFQSLIFKPSTDTCGGKNVSKINSNNPTIVLETMNKYRNISYIVQEVVKQHPALSAIHPSSINTIRVFTFLLKDGVCIPPPVLRMGVNNNITDNSSSGGIFCGITNSGRLMNRAFSGEGDSYDKHPQGYVFENCVVPSFTQILDTVKRLAPRLPKHKFIAWDMSVNEDGEPVLIEANLYRGGILTSQYCHGPLFGDKTDEVLKELFHK